MTVELPPSIDPNEKLLPPHKSTRGALVGAIIVIALLIFGALYFWGAYLNRENQTHVSAAVTEQ